MCADTKAPDTEPGCVYTQPGSVLLLVFPAENAVDHSDTKPGGLKEQMAGGERKQVAEVLSAPVAAH